MCLNVCKAKPWSVWIRLKKYEVPCHSTCVRLHMNLYMLNGHRGPEWPDSPFFSDNDYF